MATKKHSPDQPVEELEEGSPAASGGSGVIEYDPIASAAAREEELQADASAEALIPDEGLLKARDELQAFLGGAERFLATATSAAEPDKFGAENIQAIGVGIRSAGGTYTGELAVKVYVTEKVPAVRIEGTSLVPVEVNGYPVDVEEIGEIRALVYKARYPRPVPCGVSCGHIAITAGTLGCLVVLNNNRLCILSNNHVLANENNAHVGDTIIQPGRYDGGHAPQDRIGVLERFVPIQFPGPNVVDAAAAWTAFSLVKPQHVTYRLNPSPMAPGLNISVMKNGRTTQATQGVITGIAVNNVRVGYGGGRIAVFNNQIVIRGIGSAPFSQGGDSGSLIVATASRRPVGLLFAGSTTHTIANPIGAVQSQMGIARFLGG